MIDTLIDFYKGLIRFIICMSWIKLRGLIFLTATIYFLE